MFCPSCLVCCRLSLWLSVVVCLGAHYTSLACLRAVLDEPGRVGVHFVRGGSQKQQERTSVEPTRGRNTTNSNFTFQRPNLGTERVRDYRYRTKLNACRFCMDTVRTVQRTPSIARTAHAQRSRAAAGNSNNLQRRVSSPWWSPPLSSCSSNSSNFPRIGCVCVPYLSDCFTNRIILGCWH